MSSEESKEERALWLARERNARWRRRQGIPKREPAKCGSHSGYKAHLDRGEDPCDACAAAEQRHQAAAYQARKARKARKAQGR